MGAVCGNDRSRKTTKQSGPIVHIGDFLLGAGIRQLSECVYLSAAPGIVSGDATLGVP